LAGRRWQFDLLHSNHSPSGYLEAFEDFVADALAQPFLPLKDVTLDELKAQRSDCSKELLQRPNLPPIWL
jgi:hypothetical protein